MAEYWMRWVDFSKLGSLLALIVKYPGVFTATELDRIAIESGLLHSSTGKPLGPSTRYHYRRTLEKLGLVQRDYGRFTAKLDPDECQQFLPLLDSENLDDVQRLIMGNRVILNDDCYNMFWKMFMPAGRPFSLEEFIDTGKPVAMSVESTSSRAQSGSLVTLYQPALNLSIVHSGYKAVQAVHFGMRAWGVNQLQFLDELYRVGEGYIMFPANVCHRPKPTIVEEALVEAIDFSDDWATPRISDLLLTVASRLRVTLQDVRCVLDHWIRVHPGYVSPVATSERIILSGQVRQKRRLILKGFLSLASGEHISHLKVHSGIVKRIRRASDEDSLA